MAATQGATKNSNNPPLLLPYSLLIFLLYSTPSFLWAQPLEVMTYNLRYDNPGDGFNRWDMRKAAVVDLIRKYQPQAFGTQEGLLHQLAFLDGALPNYTFAGVGRDDGKREGEFAAIFYDSSRLQLIHTETFWLSPTPDTISVGWDAAMERICTFGLFEEKNTGYRFWFYNAHFDHVGGTAREESARLIVDQMEKMNTDELPVILTGDFNAVPESQPIQVLNKVLQDAYTRSGIQVQGPTGTFSGFRPDAALDRRIDYVFQSGFQVLSCRQLNDRRSDGGFISDHLPVLVRLAFE